MAGTCAVIPVYNHHAALPAVVARLTAAGLYCFLIDDGSDAQTREVLGSLHGPEKGVEVHRLPTNRGKGAAVLAGIRLAEQAGFTHAVQVDADGQHDLDRLDALLAESRRHPEALVSGRPVYDESVPRARLYGRYATHVWVWIETLSLSIRDSMCGFRVYPIEATLATAEREHVGLRMDFDTEIMVRLYWAGTECRFVDTRVHYPADGLSHFKFFADNARITLMHTRLVLGMLARLGTLLRRRYARRHWSGIRERGSLLGMRSLTLAYRLLGRRLCRLVLWPVAFYFYLFNGVARHASAQFRALAHPLARDGARIDTAPGHRNGLRHFHHFAAATLDKFIAWRDPRRIPVRFDRLEQLKTTVARGRGLLLISAHLGNLELARALTQELPEVTVNALVYTEHAQKFTRLLDEASDDYRLRLQHVQEIGPDTAMQLRERIEAGEIVVIVGDRTPVADHSPITEAPFLGRTAPFAVGPYVLGHILECPVYLFFCVAEEPGYTLYLEPFAERIRLPRAARGAHLRSLAEQYAARLAAYALRYPLQWFNFYDFWSAPHNPPAATSPERQQHEHATH